MHADEGQERRVGRGSTGLEQVVEASEPIGDRHPGPFGDQAPLGDEPVGPRRDEPVPVHAGRHRPGLAGDLDRLSTTRPPTSTRGVASDPVGLVGGVTLLEADHPAEGSKAIGVPAIETVSPWCDDGGTTPPECADEADDITLTIRAR